MNKKMRGFVDPITLGFIIALIGSSTAVVANKGTQSEENSAVAVSAVQPAGLTLAASQKELPGSGEK